MPRVPRRFSVAALAVVATGIAATALVVASSGVAAGGAAAAPAKAQTAKAACKQSGTLTYGIAGAGVTTLDPTTLAYAPEWVIMPLLYPGLTDLTPDGTVRPDLATKWKSSDDLKTWWFWIKRNARFSNGKPLTSADVVATILHDLSPSVASISKTFIADIRSVRAITKYEVRFKLGSPSAIFPDALFQAKIVDMSNPTTLATNAVGAGPYKVGTYVPNDTLTLVPNPTYFGAQPCIKKISIVAEPDPTSMVTAFTSNKLSMIWQIPVTDVPKIQADTNAVVLKPKTVSSVHVMFVDMTQPPFNNVLAREALSYAIDRPAMVKVALLGQASGAYANSLISTQSAAYDSKLAPQTFNLDKAKALFAQAGVKPGTTFTYWAQAGKRPEWITMGEILQSDLQKIGLNLKIVQNDPATWQAGFLPVGKSYPGLIIPDFLSLQPNTALGLSFALAGKCECNWNKMTGTQGAQYDAYYNLIQKALGTSDPVKRQALYNQLQELFYKVDPLLVVAHQSNIVAAQKSVVGAWVDARGNTHLENAQLKP
jgi:peptide/nickel transport system substrate-binding protein